MSFLWGLEAALFALGGGVRDVHHVLFSYWPCLNLWNTKQLDQLVSKRHDTDVFTEALLMKFVRILSGE